MPNSRDPYRNDRRWTERNPGWISRHWGDLVLLTILASLFLLFLLTLTGCRLLQPVRETRTVLVSASRPGLVISGTVVYRPVGMEQTVKIDAAGKVILDKKDFDELASIITRLQQANEELRKEKGI